MNRLQRSAGRLIDRTRHIQSLPNDFQIRELAGLRWDMDEDADIAEFTHVCRWVKRLDDIIAELIELADLNVE